MNMSCFSLMSRGVFIMFVPVGIRLGAGGGVILVSRCELVVKKIR